MNIAYRAYRSSSNIKRVSSPIVGIKEGIYMTRVRGHKCVTYGVIFIHSEWNMCHKKAVPLCN